MINIGSRWERNSDGAIMEIDSCDDFDEEMDYSYDVTFDDGSYRTYYEGEIFEWFMPVREYAS